MAADDNATFEQREITLRIALRGIVYRQADRHTFSVNVNHLNLMNPWKYATMNKMDFPIK